MDRAFLKRKLVEGSAGATDQQVGDAPDGYFESYATLGIHEVCLASE